MSASGNGLIVALDYPDLESALDMAKRVSSEVSMLKVGLELFNSVGPPAISELRAIGGRIFYDAKLYDIPNTVAGAAAAAGRLGVSMINVHALGGRAMMEAAGEAARRGAREGGFPPPLVIAVTILTSLGDRELREEIGLSGSSEEVVRLASLAQAAGLDGVVASVHEVPDIKQACGRDFVTVTPGIRPQGAARRDQSRVATPREAVAAGADYLVIGRPITRAPDPRRAVADILREMTG